jgi:hypothetical protein
MKRDGPKASNAIRGPYSLTSHLLKKANAIAGCLENPFTPCDLRHENHKPRGEAEVQTLLETVERIRPCDLQKLVNSLKLRKACGIDDIPNECLTVSWNLTLRRDIRNAKNTVK